MHGHGDVLVIILGHPLKVCVVQRDHYIWSKRKRKTKEETVQIIFGLYFHWIYILYVIPSIVLHFSQNGNKEDGRDNDRYIVAEYQT